MPIQDLVDVTISVESAGLIAQGFGVPMILGLHTRFAERFRAYTSLAGMTADGFLTTDPEYIAAGVLLSQKKRPARFLVGRRATPVAQVARIDVGATADGTYSIPINGDTASFVASGNTATQIRDGLISAVNALTGAGAVVTAAISDTDSLTLTADVAGVPFTVGTLSAGLTAVATTANVGVESDLTAIEAADASWYATVMAANGSAPASGRTEAVILRAAAWHEANNDPQRHLLIAQSNDPDAPDTAYDSVTPNDVAETLRSLGYVRTLYIWHDDDAEYVDAAVAGRMLPEDPGTETWAWKNLVGVTPAALTATERENLIGPVREGAGGKHANIYYALTDSTSRFVRGTVASGLWVDLVRYVDSLHARLSTAAANYVLAKDGKVPYTRAGIEALAAQIRGVLEGDTRAGKLAPIVSSAGELLVPAYTVTAPDLSTISDTDRQNRVLPAITFTAQYSGAIHELSITGTVAQ